MLKLLSAGRADLAISYEPELLLARAKGAKLVAIGALVQTPLTSIISLGSTRSREPGDLEGAKVGTAGIPYQDAYLKTIVDEAGIDPDRVRTINVGFNLVPGAADEASRRDARRVLERRGRRARAPRPRAEDPADGRRRRADVQRARRRRARARTCARAARCCGASCARWRSATRRCATTSARPSTRSSTPTPTSTARLQRAQVKATLPVFFPRDKDKPFGYQDPVAWKAYTQWMLDNDLLASPAGANRAFTNEFLPGEGI